MRRSLLVLLACAISSQAASISLDTAGSDPPISTPYFTFQINAGGSYSATFTNISSPPMDFTTLELTAPFSHDFYIGPGGPKAGSSCDGRNAFNTCSVTFKDYSNTVVFDFFGIDSTHPGLPASGMLGLVATSFEPNQTVGSTGTSQPAAVPEPGSLGPAIAVLVLSGLAVGRHKLLKFRVRV